jgi:hypothetical protein
VTRTPPSMILMIAGMLAVFGGMAIGAQDRYALKLGEGGTSTNMKGECHE